MFHCACVECSVRITQCMWKEQSRIQCKQMVLCVFTVNWEEGYSVPCITLQKQHLSHPHVRYELVSKNWHRVVGKTFSPQAQLQSLENCKACHEGKPCYRKLPSPLSCSV